MALGCVQDLAPSVLQSLADKSTAAVGTVRPGTGKAPLAADVHGSDGSKYMVPLASLRPPHETITAPKTSPHEHITATKAPPTPGSQLPPISAAHVFSPRLQRTIQQNLAQD